MSVPIRTQLYLPANLAITERSRAFYDGTYEWNSDGFTDEYGVYREFDCYVPEARAPTPLPPMFPDDDSDIAQEETPNEEQAQVLETDRAVIPCPKRNGIAASILRAPEGKQSFTIPSNETRDRNIKTPQNESLTVSSNDLIAENQDGETVASKTGNVVTASEQVETKLSLNENYKLSEPTLPDKKEAGDFKMPYTPPKSPTTSVVGAQTISPASTTSTLSPVPSNLSDQDKDMSTEIGDSPFASQSTASLPNTPSKRTPLSKMKATAKATTRGIARKVIKGGKKTSGSKSSPLKRLEDSVEDFTLLQLHSGEFLRKSGRRKSVRQAKSQDK